MKKVLILIMIAVILLSMISCAPADKDDSATDNDTNVSDNTQTNEDAGNTDTEDTENTEEGNTTEGLTVAQALLEDFKNRVSEDPSLGAQAIVDGLLQNEVILFSGASMPVEAGLLTGFGNAEIKGFKEGVMFAPMIGSIPFVGYVFVLEDGTDAETFVTTLTDNADPRWNICTEADETVAEHVGNVVFFVMSPNQFEE